MGLSWQKANIRNPPVLTSDHQHKKRDTAFLLLALKRLDFNLVFIDEYSVNDHVSRNYAWGKRGQGVNIVLPDRKKGIHVMAAISNNGLEHLETELEGMNDIRFVEFLKNLYKKLGLRSKKKNASTLLLMDGATIHTSDFTKDFCF